MPLTQIKVFPLHVGDTKVPFGQFYGGLEGWSGFGAFYHFVTDKRHYLWVPIYAYAIVHPQYGTVLVDAGINPDQVYHHDQYYRGLMNFILDQDEYRQSVEQTLPVALKASGLALDDIRQVVVTHLHEDHVGGLHFLPGTPRLVSRPEWEQRHYRLFGFLQPVYQPSLEPHGLWRQYDYDGGPHESFAASHDLFGDGSVLLLPTPGHTPGHTAVLVRQADYELLIAGDCLYTLAHLAVDDIRAFNAGKVSADIPDTIRRLQRLAERRPQLVFAPEHDHTPYGRMLAESLHSGVLSGADRARLQEYQASILTGCWRLREKPRWHAGLMR